MDNSTAAACHVKVAPGIFEGFLGVTCGISCFQVNFIRGQKVLWGFSNVSGEDIFPVKTTCLGIKSIHDC